MSMAGSWSLVTAKLAAPDCLGILGRFVTSPHCRARRLKQIAATPLIRPRRGRRAPVPGARARPMFQTFDFNPMTWPPEWQVLVAWAALAG